VDRLGVQTDRGPPPCSFRLKTALNSGVGWRVVTCRSRHLFGRCLLSPSTNALGPLCRAVESNIRLEEGTPCEEISSSMNWPALTSFERGYYWLFQRGECSFVPGSRRKRSVLLPQVLPKCVSVLLVGSWLSLHRRRRRSFWSTFSRRGTNLESPRLI